MEIKYGTSLRLLLNAAVPVLVHLLGIGNLQWSHQPEPEPLSVGVIPDALRQLRILLLPGWVGAYPRAAAQLFRLVCPGAAAYSLRIWLGRHVPGIVRAQSYIPIRVVLIEGPF